MECVDETRVWRGGGGGEGERGEQGGQRTITLMGFYILLFSGTSRVGRLWRGIDDGDLKPGVTSEWDGREGKARERERERLAEAETEGRERGTWDTLRMKGKRYRN